VRVIEWIAVRPGTVEALVGVAELLALGGEVAHINDGRVHLHVPVGYSCCTINRDGLT
jgi:predicted DNA-binding protein with PD1-like motif